MSTTPAKLKDRAARKSARRDSRKRQIAESAIKALQELGYANTSLRDIAAKSDLSLGMLHYYFEDRSDLIIYCVQMYKQEFVGKMRAALDRASGRDAVIDGFAGALASSIADDAMTHRLWYDIRNQAMFDEAFRPVVTEIEGMLIGLVARAIQRSGQAAPALLEAYYAPLDGTFRYLLQDQLGARRHDPASHKAMFAALLDQFL